MVEHPNLNLRTLEFAFPQRRERAMVEYFIDKAVVIDGLERIVVEEMLDAANMLYTQVELLVPDTLGESDRERVSMSSRVAYCESCPDPSMMAFFEEPKVVSYKEYFDDRVGIKKQYRRALVLWTKPDLVNDSDGFSVNPLLN